MINSATHYDKDRTCTPEENQVFKKEEAGIGANIGESKAMELGNCNEVFNYGGFLEPPWTLNGPGGG